MSKTHKPFDQMTDEEMRAYQEEGHAEKYPNGCPGGMCEACVKRLGLVRAPCRSCGKPIYVQNGKVLTHDIRVGGRPGYRARSQECQGSRQAPQRSK